MKLSEKDQKKIIKWIEEKIGQPRCTMCGQGKWTILDVSTLPIGFDLHTTRFHYHQGVPQVTIACNTCGHMVFFNTGIMGFKPDEPVVEEVIEESSDENDS